MAATRMTARFVSDAAYNRSSAAPGHIKGYLLRFLLRFNLHDRLLGRATPANLSPKPRAEVWACFTASRGAT
jgi:hypothetical protein